MKRFRYFARAAKHGWRWLRHPLENAGLAAGVLALFGLPTTIGVMRGTGVPGLAVGLVLSLIAVTLEGTYQLWREVDRRDRAVDVFYTSFSAWNYEVERFLESRKASRPPVPKDNQDLARLIQIRVRGKMEPAPIDPAIENAKEAAEAHDRETLSIYIEKYRDRTSALYDGLVNMGVLVKDDRMRQRVRKPKSKFDIADAMHIIWLGAESDLRRYL